MVVDWREKAQQHWIEQLIYLFFISLNHNSNLFNMKPISKLIFAMMLMTAMALVTGCKPEENPDSGNTLNGHEYVDLGLPSGTLWAACNVGANTPEEYGDYFAWGETAPKTTYNWSNYKYCNGGDGWNTLIKYCNDASYGYNGFADNLTILLPEDDAATANWGSGWCMPTADQWDELRDNTNTSWITQNGVGGCLFTASNGHSLFLPAAGRRWGGELYDAGSHGGYWSGSLYTVGPLVAWNFYFDSDNDGMGNGNRDVGLSVRPVRSSPQN